MGVCGIEANQDITRKQSNLLTHPASLHPDSHPPRSAHNKLPASSDAVSIWNSSDSISRGSCLTTRGLSVLVPVPRIGEWGRAEVWVGKKPS